LVYKYRDVNITAMNKNKSELENRFLAKLGNNIRKARQKSNISQESLSSLADLDRTYIGGIERGERNVLTFPQQ